MLIIFAYLKNLFSLICGFLIPDSGFRVLGLPTDYKTQIDHMYTNIPHQVQSSGTLESYDSDHKPIFVCLNITN